jgi:hypothetical protein
MIIICPATEGREVLRVRRHARDDVVLLKLDKKVWAVLGSHAMAGGQVTGTVASTKSS